MLSDVDAHLRNCVYQNRNVQHLIAFSPPRLWNHYSPTATSTISYELFLEKLGFCVSHNFKIAPVCTRLGKNMGNYRVDLEALFKWR